MILTVRKFHTVVFALPVIRTGSTATTMASDARVAGEGGTVSCDKKADMTKLTQEMKELIGTQQCYVQR